MKKQIRLMSAALAACTLLSAGGAPAFAADSGQEHNYTILREITDDTDFMWFPEGETMRFEQDGKYGLKKLDDTVVLPAVYSDIDFPFVAETNDLIITQNGRRGVVAQDGRIILDPEWKDVSLGEEYITVLSTDNKYGFADYNGNIVIEPQYDDAGTFFRGYAPVGKDLKYSYIDADNNLLVPWQDEEMYTWDGKYFSIRDLDADTVKIIDGTGRVITDNEYEDGAQFVNGKAAAVLRKSDGRCGVINPQNQAIVPLVYDSVMCCWTDESDPSSVIFAASVDGKTTFFDQDGNRLGNEIWDDGQECGGELGKGILVEKNGKVGMIDLTGKVMVEPIYDKLDGAMYDTVAFAYQDGKVGLIDARDGTVLVEPRWQPFRQNSSQVDGAIAVHIGDDDDPVWEMALLNEKGQIVIAPDEIGDIMPIGNGYLYLTENNYDSSNMVDGGTGRSWLAKINDTIVPRDPSILDAGGDSAGRKGAVSGR
ncbi:WG repeat-containing protein [Agathobaculum sp.]|uniref:WG repeat-containing protein n=1 Tax=Agathobaculum sp. TaxID=2048138 RepID=UPI0039A22860